MYFACTINASLVEIADRHAVKSKTARCYVAIVYI